MLCKQNAVLALPIHVHLFDVFPLDDILVYQWWWLPLEVIEIGSGDDLIPLRKRPEFAILQVYVLQVVVGQLWEGERTEFESILQSDLVLLEAIHVVQI